MEQILGMINLSKKKKINYLYTFLFIFLISFNSRFYTSRKLTSKENSS
jgi:hypothetical protein